jgi:hypothetical protein
MGSPVRGGIMLDDKQLEETENLLNIVPLPKALYKVEDKDYMRAFLSYSSGKYTLVPELAEILPFEILIKLLSVFAGQSLDIPEYKSLLNTVRDLDIFFSLRNTPTAVEVTRLSQKYSLTVPAIKWISEKVAEAIDTPAPVKD